MGLSSAYSFLQTDKGYVGLSSYERKMITKVDRFTDSSTWTVPSGVTYAIAHIRGGGGGIGTASSGTGGNSSVAFASGTITANGGVHTNLNQAPGNALAGATNSGNGATAASWWSNTSQAGLSSQNGAYIVAGADVTPAASITVTVGAGGTAGTSGAAGGGGYVWIEYQVAL